MTRVVLIVPAFPRLSETFIVNMFWGLLQHDFDVHVVCAESESALWKNFQLLDKEPKLRARVHVTLPSRPRWLVGLFILPVLLRLCLRNPVGTWVYLYRGWPLFGFRVLRRLYVDAELVLLRPDVIHFEFGALAVGRTYLKDLLGCRCVVSFRGYDVNYVGLEQANFYEDVWNRADGLHFLGEDLYARAQQRGCPKDKLYVLIPPAIDAVAFTPKRRTPNPYVAGQSIFRILSVGRLEWKKGYEYALQAVRRLIDQGIKCEYRIVGAGDYLEAIAFARHQLGLDGYVVLLGALSATEVKEQMQWADVMLHAAVSEGFCNAVLEGQAMALPVVCTDADGLAENVIDGETGFVVHRRRPELLATKLEELARDPLLRYRIGDAGRRRINQHFQLSKQMEKFESLYKKVLATPDEANEQNETSKHPIHRISFVNE
jgi:colanic acid/amylovoran biosynthesis glycosyltransferase